jgi:hypothetical protein
MAKFITGLFFGMCIGGYLVAMNGDLFNDVKCASWDMFTASDAGNCSDY